MDVKLRVQTRSPFFFSFFSTTLLCLTFVHYIPRFSVLYSAADAKLFLWGYLPSRSFG